ncbi:MAG TPA: N-acetylmuramoyl-L-alanine amidase [Candidatus Baltobacteraceae bacterium]|nr:N-acetylmuramoyl-L-alanine amidase [Candidatus Baltobacteraceae bacterium]
MKLTSRYAVRTGSVFALALAVALAAPAARAADRAAYSFEGKRITFTQIVDQSAGRAISIDDPGLETLFQMLGATVTYQSGQRYVLVTTAEPVVISFAIGDTRYDVGPVTQTAPLAPFVANGHAFVPLDELLQALELLPKPQGGVTVLQPQLASLDVQSSGGETKLVAHGAIPLDARISAQDTDRVEVLFDGVASVLAPSRTIDSGPVRRIDVRTSGTITHPATYVTLYLAPGVSHSAIGTDDQRDVTMGFDGAAPAQPIAQAAPPETTSPPEAQPQDNGQNPPAAAPAPQLVHVTGVTGQQQNGGFSVRIAMDGPASFDWRRLRPPDNRWWIDIHGARLASPPDQPGDSTVTDVRAHQENADTVRVALSLADFQNVSVVPDESGITVTVGDQLAAENAPRAGTGTTGPNAVANTAANSPPGWKFGPQPGQSNYVAANPRLIVIDPGHGGSDTGAIRGDLVEKSLNLDMSKRLRDILVARGWDVIMTREDDRDVYAANDSAQEELQARDDIANSRGARLLISMHSNSYINDGPHGATVYFYKPGDLALAQDVDRRIAAELGIFNNGVIKDKLYVIHHANMPAVLVETAFLSNPDDRALLGSSEWRQKMAQAIADGIGDYTGPVPPATSASNQ